MNTDLLSRFPETHVLVLGDAILDEYLSGDCSRLSPEAPVPVLRVTQFRQTLGGAANAAANIAALGGRAQLIALRGRDGTGERLAELCTQAGVELAAISDDRPTLRKARVIGQHQQLVRLDFEDSRPIDTDAEARVLALVRERLQACDIVVLSDYAKGLLTQGVCDAVISEAHALGKQVLADPRPEHRHYYQHCDYVTPNWKESRGLLGQPEEAATGDRIDATGCALVRALDTNVLLTLGPDGMAFFGRDGRERFSVPTEAREVFDVSGAGDTVVAAFALARAAGALHAEAVALANRAAGIVVGKFGTATVTCQELLADQSDVVRRIGRTALAPLAAALRSRGKRIVTIAGAFDGLHAGHLHCLREASRQGDVLIAGLASDASVRGTRGSERPRIPQAQRADMLLALRYVDYVHVFDEPACLAFLEELRPDVHVASIESGQQFGEASLVSAWRGRVHLTERIPECREPRVTSRMPAAGGAVVRVPDRAAAFLPGR